MNTQRLTGWGLAALLLAFSGAGAAQTDPRLEAILAVSEEKTEAARQSQARVDKLAEETRSLLNDYRNVLKEIEGLKIHNERLRRQIARLKRRAIEIEDAIAQVTVTSRQMMPLILRMIDSLEQFVELDVPFHINERRQRIAFLKGNVDRADISVAEKFRQVLEAYKIENEYGRKIDSYKGSVEIDGVERDVNFLRIGRIALLYQTTDADDAGVWDQASRSWVELGGSYQTPISKGLRIARKEASIDLLTLPIAAPEEIEE